MGGEIHDSEVAIDLLEGIDFHNGNVRIIDILVYQQTLVKLTKRQEEFLTFCI